MDLASDIPTDVNISIAKFQKMMFLINALNGGWTIKKKNKSYIFTKKHKNQRKVFQNEYLENFVSNNIEIDDESIADI